MNNDEVVNWIKQQAGNSSFLDLGYDIVVSVGSKYSEPMRKALKRELTWKKKQNRINDYLQNNTGEWVNLKTFLTGIPEARWNKITYLKLIVKHTLNGEIGYLGTPRQQKYGQKALRFIFIHGIENNNKRDTADYYEVFLSEDAQAKILGLALDLKKK